MFKLKTIFFYTLLLSFVISCKKEDKFVDCNEAPDYYGVETVKVKNYVNRIFIDLIGREPLDTEMDSLIAILESNRLSFTTRDAIINSLQTDTIPGANGESYREQYFNRMYELQKARFIEGLPDAEIQQEINIVTNSANTDSIFGDMLNYQFKKNIAARYQKMLDANADYKNDSIDFGEVCQRMCYNGIYDNIHMNSFNFVNAVFDNLFYRFPTQVEFNSSYEMVEDSQSDILFGQSGTSKFDFLEICTKSGEFYDGTVNWVYKTYVARTATPQEEFSFSVHYASNNDLHYLIKEVLKTDEYANF